MKSNVYCDDFFNIVDKVRDVDLIVTSPPYFDARDYGGVALFADANQWKIWCMDALLKLAECIKDSGVIWWNTGSGYRDHHKMTEMYHVILALESVKIYLIDDIPWIKKSAPPKNIKNRPHAAWEHNYIFSKKPSAVTFYKDQVRQPYAPATISRMKYKLGRLTPDKAGDYGEEDRFVKPNPLGAAPPNYLILPQDTTKRPHPAPMLPALANWAIRAYSKEDDLVFDPMMGVGTTWIECMRLNRNFVGCERVQSYFLLADKSALKFQIGDDPYHGLGEEKEK